MCCVKKSWKKLMFTHLTLFVSCINAIEVYGVELDDVLKSWNTRSERVASARFEWTEDNISLNRRSLEKAVPEIEHISVKGSHTLLIFDGEKFRYESIGLTYRNGLNGEELKRISSFNGKLEQVFYPKGVVPLDRGIISECGSFGGIRSLPLLGLMLAFRPLRSTELGRAEGRLRLLDEPVVIDDREVLVLEKEVDERGLSELLKVIFYIDPAREYLPLRYTVMVGGRLSTQVDIGYEQDEKVGWVPINWSVVRYNKVGNLLHYSCKGKVLNYSINEDIPASVFEIDFPVGTQMTDTRKGNYVLAQPDVEF